MKKHFLTGLVIFLPLAVTIAIIGGIVDFITGPFFCSVSGVVRKINLPPNESLHRYVTKFVILVAIFVFTVLLGMIARWFFFKSLLSLGDKILHRIPLIRTVYKTIQDIIRTLLGPGSNSFKQVVLVPFPKDGIYALGFVTHMSPPVCDQKINKDLICVLLPTAPMPTSGFLLMFPKEKVLFVDLAPEEAIKYILSCGILIPQDPSSQLNTVSP